MSGEARARHGAEAMSAAAKGILAARPRATPAGGGEGPGTHALHLGPGRDALLYVPRQYDPGRPAALVVLLHGAGGRAPDLVPRLAATAEARAVLILAPQSRDRTWDVIMGGYGSDLADLDLALGQVFGLYAIRADRVAIGGFSDGASYALSLGLANGALFSDVLAFSPGFAAPGRSEGRPRLFICHGVRDAVLPIDACGRSLARKLREAGYDLDYREFDGGHAVPPEMVIAAMARFLN